MTHTILLKNIVYMPDPVCYILKSDIFPIKVSDLHLEDSFETYDDITDDGYPVIDSSLIVDTYIHYQKVNKGIRIEFGRRLSSSLIEIEGDEEFGLYIREYMDLEAKIISKKNDLKLEEYENSESTLSILYSFEIRETNNILIKDVIEQAESLVLSIEKEVLEEYNKWFKKSLSSNLH
ncbi:hypothetical protein AB7942_29490 [Neobacillus sp. BF23-41]|uniref:hypothetical protein n=1 Tax=Neobacillus sp. BF23-41 TaxID=3240280 RepID=UPI0034E5046E